MIQLAPILKKWDLIPTSHHYKNKFHFNYKYKWEKSNDKASRKYDRRIYSWPYGGGRFLREDTKALAIKERTSIGTVLKLWTFSSSKVLERYSLREEICNTYK